MNIYDLVEDRPEIVGHTATLREVSRLMALTHHHAVGVVNGSTFAGIFTDHDLIIAVSDGVDVEIAQVQDWMTPVPDAIRPDVGIGDALKWMMDGGYRHLPIVDDEGDLVGILSMRDLVGGALHL